MSNFRGKLWVCRSVDNTHDVISCARRALKGADLAAWRHSPAAVLPPPPKLKTAAAALVGEGDAALQMARCNVSKDAFYSGAVRGCSETLHASAHGI